MPRSLRVLYGARLSRTLGNRSIRAMRARDELGDDLRVFLPAGSSGLRTPTIKPSVITPNGDGRNEQLTVHFALVGLEASRQLRAVVYDLGGATGRSAARPGRAQWGICPFVGRPRLGGK